ncbi:MAG TPA: FumA C-terminus/TtdB family hydratase beta subunit [Armatimonadota bacterium]|nr:FumA C-terminus/TtdB family hydratase beta subunit [Armatimonadota bacterium]
MNEFYESMLDLVTQTATNLPADVRRSVERAMRSEQPDSRSGQALDIIALNIDMACERELPICQDTGMPTFEVRCPVGANQIVMTQQIREAVAEATRRGKLRTNSVDSLTGKNSGDNLGPGTPVIHFDQWDRDEIEVRLLLKGGGCENKNIQYSLPCEVPHLGRADRDLDGIRKCILHAVYQAQGQGCSAGFIGVSIGGDRTTGYSHAKEQLFREVDDINPNPTLAELEAYVMANSNKLGIGTMGFGGQVTLLGCKIGVQNRIPASFFVSVAYNCWAYRRLGVVLDPDSGAIRNWLYRDEHPAAMARTAGFPVSGREVRLTTPLSEEAVRALRVGDVVLLSGMIYTGRDQIHHYLLHHDPPVDLHGGVIYHCGPVMLKEDGEWRVKAAGPTTSIREEPFQADVIRRHGIRMVIGKGGMGPKTLNALQEEGAVYLNAIGGAAQYYSTCVMAVRGVDYLEEFGIPEAMWRLECQDFAAVVTMDSHGSSLHQDVDTSSAGNLTQLREPAYA